MRLIGIVLVLLVCSIVAAAPVFEGTVSVTACIPAYLSAATVSLDPLVMDVAANVPWVAVVTTNEGEVRVGPAGHFAGYTRLLWWREGVTVQAVRVEVDAWQR